MITSESSSQLKMPGLYMRSNNNSGYRKSITHSFCHCVDICVYTGKIMTEEFSTSSVTALNAIGNIYSTIFIAKRSYQLKKSFIGNIDATHTLDPFNNNGGNIFSILFKTFFQCFFIIERNEDHIIRFIDRCDIVFVIGCRNCEGSPAMK